jgi:hypothetical protein
VGILGGVLATSLQGGLATPREVEQLLGPERGLLSPALLASLSAGLRAGLGRVFWAAAAIALLAWLAGLLFPALAIAPRAAAEPAAEPPAV